MHSNSIGSPKDPYHVFIDFKKAFDRVLHAALWATMKKYNISTNLIQVIKNLFNKATSAVLFNGSIGDWFRTTAGVRQGCLLSPTLFNIFLERIMTDALRDHEGTVNIGGRTITNIRFAVNIDGLAGEEEELAKLVERLDTAFPAYGMEISAEKTKLTTNNTSGIDTNIKVNRKKLETVISFKYLDSVITDEGSQPEKLSRIAQTTAAVTRLTQVWNGRSIFLIFKIRLMRSPRHTLTAELQRRVQAMKMGCYRKILIIPYKDFFYLRGSPCQDSAGNRTTRKPPDHYKET